MLKKKMTPNEHKFIDDLLIIQHPLEMEEKLTHKINIYESLALNVNGKN